MTLPFHLAIPVKSLEPCRTFYREILLCEEGRSDTHWVDFNFFGHQLVLHQKDNVTPQRISNPVDGHDVPVPHFGVHLKKEVFEHIKSNLESKNISYIDKPYTRFKGTKFEQNTFFIEDPHGNVLELKTFG